METDKPTGRSRSWAALAFAAFVVAAFAPIQAGLAAAGERLILPVPVATIYPGETILPGGLAPRAFRPTMPGRTAMAADAVEIIGKVARRTLLPGRPVPRAAVADPELVQRGQPVEIVYRERGLTIRAQAMTLQGGAAGALIRVRNLDSGLIVNGTIEPDGTVRVGTL